MPVSDFLNKVNSGPFSGGAPVTNAAIVEKKTGAEVDVVGVNDFTKSDSKKVDGDTLFGEGSIGKVRFAGLAYMMEQAEIINLQDKAGEFFAKESTEKFLKQKYGEKQGENLQKEIGNFFSGDSANATIADLTTHRAGVGDLTRDHAGLCVEKGVETKFELPDLLIIPQDKQVIPRDENGKPSAQDAPNVLDKNLPQAQQGKHQYSNLGYMLLGLALEASYAEKNPENVKDYKQLTRDFLLDPKEGFAKDKVKFDDTKFPEELSEKDNVVKNNWFEKGKLVDGNKFSAANAAGGMFTSVNDSTKFFEEFFNGFPGTPEFGKEGANKFFSRETIASMKNEWEKYPNPPANQNDIDKAKANKVDAEKMPPLCFQGPGFTVNYKYDEKFYDDPKKFLDEHSPINYGKGGGTVGYASGMNFNPQTKTATVGMQNRENVTGEIARKWGENIDYVLNRYREGNKFDRSKMVAENMPQPSFDKSEIGDAIKNVVAAIAGNQKEEAAAKKEEAPAEKKEAPAKTENSSAEFVKKDGARR